MTHQPVPFVDLVSPHRELEDEFVEVFRESLRSAAFVGGPQVEGFEREFADYCGVSDAVGVSSGTDALRFALMAAGVGPGDAVVTVAHTFIATVEAISQVGAATEFVDIDERTYNMSPGALAEYLDGCRVDPVTGRPVGHRSGKAIAAVLPVHLYGQMADMDPILQLAERYNLLVVEDVCQAHGAEYLSSDGFRRAGSMGRAAAFSFYPGKNLGACGEGGAVTTNDHDVARTVRMLREHGQTRKYFHELEGFNGRLDAIQAGFLRVKLRRLDTWNAKRRAAARTYDQLLSAVGGLAVPGEADGRRSVYHLYVVQVDERDEVAAYLARHRVSTGLHYPVPVHLQNCYRYWGYTTGSLPVTEVVASRILSLPMFPGLTGEQQIHVCNQITKFEAQVTS